MKRIFAGVLLAAGLLLAPVAGSESAPTARAALDRFLQGLETFSAGFTQTLTDETGFLLQEAEGRMLLALPDRLRWELQAPFEQTIVADGRDVWLHDPELRQVTVRPVDEALESSPLALLTQPHRLDERFTVVDDPGLDGLWLVLMPRTRDADFTRLELELTPAGELLGLAFVDVFGQRTDVRLHDTRRNQWLDSAAFGFDLPPGTDVYRP